METDHRDAFGVYVSGNCCIMYAMRMYRSALWFIVGVAAGVAGFILILTPTVAGGG